MIYSAFLTTTMHIPAGGQLMQIHYTPCTKISNNLGDLLQPLPGSFLFPCTFTRMIPGTRLLQKGLDGLFNNRYNSSDCSEILYIRFRINTNTGALSFTYYCVCSDLYSKILFLMATCYVPTYPPMVNFQR